MARSLEERVTGLLGSDDKWCQLQGREGDGAWSKFVTRIPPEMVELIEHRITAPGGPRSRQEMFIAAMRLYFEAVEPESNDDVPLDGIDVVHINQRRLNT